MQMDPLQALVTGAVHGALMKAPFEAGIAIESEPVLDEDGMTNEIRVRGKTSGTRLLIRVEVEGEFVTATGRVLTDADIEKLSDEAERGYDSARMRELTEAERKRLRESHGVGAGRMSERVDADVEVLIGQLRELYATAPYPAILAAADELEVGHGVHSDAAAEFCRWLVSMDDPENAHAAETRVRITLDEIINKAREAIT